MTSQPYDAEADVQRLLELNDLATRVSDEQRQIKARLDEQLGLGSHAVAGVKITVTAPSRRFDLDVAVKMLTDEQKRLATVESYDAKTVKSFLPPVLLDQAMTPGNGANIVRVTA